MPGGKREPGESDWDGLFREIQEEGKAISTDTIEDVSFCLATH